jgi:hypothetical protein
MSDQEKDKILLTTTVVSGLKGIFMAASLHRSGISTVFDVAESNEGNGN